jgi:hypothetical protein
MLSSGQTRRFHKLTLDALHRPVVASIAVCMSLAELGFASAAECAFPDNVNWVVSASCEVSAIRIAPQNLSVTNGATLTVESSGEIILDMRNFAINVAPDSRLIVEPGGRVRSNQIGPLLVRQSDGGSFGYFLKRVGGPVLDTINPDLSFHPSSAIKVLYMIEALRQVDNGTFNLTTTQLNSCPGVDTDGDGVPDDFTLVAGAGQTCPVSFAQASGGGGGGNCNVATNTVATCGFPPINYSLGLGMCAMMKVSNNPAANAIQETVGGGNPQTGWNNMINNAGAAIGLTSTTFASRMGCGGPNNVPNNQTTLRDLGRIYEGMATDPNVLYPVNPPANFTFPIVTTTPLTMEPSYNFMDNHVNELNSPNFVGPIVNEQAGEAGISITTTTNFMNGILLVHKTGSNGAALLGCNLGGVCVPAGCTPLPINPPNCPDPTQGQFRTVAGWISLPINGGADTRDYVYGIFVNNVTASSIIATGTTPNLDPTTPSVSVLNRSMLDEAGELLRPVIRDALERF